MSNVIPGTSIVIPEPEGDWQPEGRGLLGNVHQGHVGPPLTAGREYDQDDPGPYVPGPHNQEAARVLDGILSTLRKKGLREERSTFEQMGAQTAATTGNLVARLHQCPQGWEAHVTQVTVDVPGSATITPAAPFANAASFMFLAITNSGGDNPGAVAAMRAGMVAFAPTSAGGPILPGQWTFNEENAPVLFGGEELYLCLSGGSQAAIANIALQLNVRIQSYSNA